MQERTSRSVWCYRFKIGKIGKSGKMEVQRRGDGNFASNYLNNVPIRTCISLARFHVGRQDYSCNRGSICTIDCIQSIKQDADITLLVNYLSPNLLYLTEKSEISYLRRGEVPTSEKLPSSAQNYGFTRYCLAASVAWIQDAGYLLETKFGHSCHQTISCKSIILCRRR